MEDCNTIMLHIKTTIDPRNYRLRLERYSEDIAQIAHKLNSYSYEPTTIDLFERKASLKTKMDSLKLSNVQIISAIKNNQEVMENQIMAQVNDILNLKSEFQEYHSISNDY
jgi:multidrug resistance efflux pump